MFFDGHMHAFSYYGGVFRELVYDNLTQAVQRILRGRQRVEQERFVSFRSHYTFQARYCTPGRGQEKDQPAYCTSLFRFDAQGG